MHPETLDLLLTQLEESDFTITSLIQLVLKTESASCTNLLENAATICRDLHACDGSSEAVFGWAFDTVKAKVCQEVTALSIRAGGLQFNAKTLATSAHLEGSFMEFAAEKMRKEAPCLWKLVGHLLDANEKCRRVAPQAQEKAPGTVSEDAVIQGMGSEKERDLGEFGGHGDRENSMEVDSDTSSDKAMDVEDEVQDKTSNRMKKKEKRRMRAAERNAALLVIVR